MTAERDNLLAALRHAAEVADADTAIRLGAALSWYWTLRGRHDEAAVWLELALSVPGESSPSAHLLVKVLHTLSAAAAGQVMPSEEQTDEFVGLARQLDLTRAHPLISLIEPAIALLRDDSEAGQAAIDRHLVDADPWARAMLHMMRCAMAENDGDLERLEASLPVARKSFEDVGDRWGIAAAISAQALLTAGRGDVEGAIADLQTARRLMTELQANEDESYTLIRIAGLRMRIGDLETARRDLDLADQTAERIGNLWGTVSTRISRAVLAAYEGDQSTGRRLAAEAVALAEQITSGPPQLRGSTHAVAAMFDVRAGDFDLARSRLGVAYEATITSRDMPVGAMVALAAADLDTAMDHPRRAAELVGVATQLRGYADTTDLEYLRIERDLRNRLGAQEYARRYEQGAELTRPEALELLRSVVRPEGEPSIGLPQHKGGVISPPQ
jgi:tetratricopeptide (TPR) repeat protein